MGSVVEGRRFLLVLWLAGSGLCILAQFLFFESSGDFSGCKSLGRAQTVAVGSKCSCVAPSSLFAQLPFVGSVVRYCCGIVVPGAKRAWPGVVSQVLTVSSRAFSGGAANNRQ